MKTWQLIIVVLVVAAGAFFIGRASVDVNPDEAILAQNSQYEQVIEDQAEEIQSYKTIISDVRAALDSTPVTVPFLPED
jgi:predicted NUDIX family phosphoesterase